MAKIARLKPFLEYNTAMSKIRADRMLVDRGLAEDLSQARRFVMAGQVRADGQVVFKPSVQINANATLTVDTGPRFVSRGGEKLAAALDVFPVQVSGVVCADVGASTGGFTDCLLQAGAEKVYAIDVGHGILHWDLRNDPRVVVMERTNARHVHTLPESIRVVTIDASFISVRTLLPVVKGWLAPEADLVVLIKPQFEARREVSARGQGVVSDPDAHRSVLVEVLTAAEATSYSVRGLVRSPVRGPKGNVEFLAWLAIPASGGADLEALIEGALI